VNFSLKWVVVKYNGVPLLFRLQNCLGDGAGVEAGAAAGGGGAGGEAGAAAGASAGVAAGEGGAGGEAGVAACSLNASASCSLGGAGGWPRCMHVISQRGGDAGRHCPFAPVRTPHNACAC